MKTRNLFLAFLLVFVGVAKSATLPVTNLNIDGDGIYGLFNSSGVLIPRTVTENIKLGYFSGMSTSNVEDAWNAGNLALLNTNWQSFGSIASMNDNVGVDGYFDAAFDTFSTPFASNPIYLWVSTGSDFTDTNAEYFIYQFSANFAAEPWDPDSLILGQSAGNVVVGGNTFSNDYGFGSGPLTGFNTVSVVPEPATYAAIFGVLALALVAYRRRRA